MKMIPQHQDGVIFGNPEAVDVVTALDMICVGIVPTRDISPVGTEVMLHGDIPVITQGERTREQFLTRIAEMGRSVANFDACPADYKFEAIEAKYGHETKRSTTK